MFKISVILILIFGIALSITPLLRQNFYFTVDQGVTAVYVREILEHGRIFLKGQETSIRGVFAGPLWYYFQALGYAVFAGHPFGGIFVLILLKIFTFAGFTFWIYKKIGWRWALISFFAQQIFWPSYSVSLWAFNPFPLAALSIIFISVLSIFLGGERKFFYYALFIVFLSLNTDLAGAAVFMAFLILVGVLGLKKKIISRKDFLIGGLLVPLLGVLGIVKQFFDIFFKTKVISYNTSGIGVFSGTNFSLITSEFVKIFGSVILPQNILIGSIVFIFVIGLYLKVKKPEVVSQRFIFLTFGLFILSFLFFSSNRGWKDWHTVYLAPLLFSSLFLMLSQIPKKFSIILASFVIIFQSLYTVQRIKDYMKPTDDPSILYNQISTIDWIYQNSEDQGFAVYNYTDRFYDYTYQYLFSWYGLKKYGFLPCEYSNYPLSAKELYVPGAVNYLDPKRGCDRVKFLIIESDTNGETNRDWIDKFRKYHTLVETTSVGKIVIEKYYVKIGSPDDFCIWLERCGS